MIYVATETANSVSKSGIRDEEMRVGYEPPLSSTSDARPASLKTEIAGVAAPATTLPGVW
jgi:hypothetical protein